MFFINSLAAAALLVLFGLSFIPPSKVPLLPAITLTTPVVIVINVIFLLYWLVQLNKKSLLSFISLVLCFSFFSHFFQFGFGKEEKPTNNSLKILSYNSYRFRGIETGKKFKEEFIGLVNDEQPDIIFFQEVNVADFNEKLPNYKYRQATVTNARPQGANPIFSKYPIINWGSVGMDDVHIGRNTLYVDIKVNKDTVRCYNAHLTSYRYTKKLEELKQIGPKSIVKRANTVFKYQEQQLEKIVAHMKTSAHPVIFCGDFNNMAFSYVYRELKNAGGLKDTFSEAGEGFGATIFFPFFPTRIDFILVQENIKVFNHRVIKTRDWSDHYPVIAEIALP